VSELFMSLYLDEDVDVLVATLLRAKGFQAVTTVEAGNIGASDDLQLQFAATAGHVLLTHNRVDFERLAADWLADGKPHAGMIVAVRRPAYEIARRLLVIVNDVAADEIANQVLYV
jgi:predicted nuclease of predicted toxin-antitoxin system